MADIRETIARIASENGIDPAYALAVAERESDFNPDDRASKSIYGLFQMSGALRQKYGVPDGADVPTQVRGFAAFTRDLQGEMAGALGRQPTNAELYLGHFWGAPRAARVIAGQTAGLSPTDVFSPRELAENPELSKGQTAGRLASTIMGDINRRQAKYGGDIGNGENPVANGDNYIDFAQFGQPGEGGDQGHPIQVAANGPLDFSVFGKAADDQGDALQRNYQRNQAWTKPGASNFNTDLGDKEQAFRDWVKQNKVPFNPDAKGPQDYDMRGFWQALQAGDAKAKSAIDPNDQRTHYPDYWKTPYDATFSSESQWADPKKAPSWNDQDQLVTPDGKVLFDDKTQPNPEDPNAPPKGVGAPAGPDFSVFGRAGDQEPAAPGTNAAQSPDFASFGSPVDLKVNNRAPGQEIDLASLIRPAAVPQPNQAANPGQIIDDYNATSDFKNRPLPPVYQDLNRQNENNLVPPPPAAGSADLGAPIPV